MALFQNKLRLLKNEQDFFKNYGNRELKDYVFRSEGTIKDYDLDDIWSIYKIEYDYDCYFSLES